MTILEFADRVADAMEVAEEKHTLFREAVVFTAVAVLMRTAPPPDDFDAGETSEDFERALAVVTERLEQDPVVREAIAKHFHNIGASLGEQVTAAQREKLTALLEEFSAHA